MDATLGRDVPPPLVYPAPLERERDGSNAIQSSSHDIDIETPILIVGGGPVGMLLALMFARIHGQECMLIEREHDTTTYPKMEYTNGRSMEIYRAMGLAEEFRAVAAEHLSEDASWDEVNISSLNPSGHVIHNWERKRTADHRKDSRDNNDGSKYLEPHLRAHQIIVEAWLKKCILRESKIRTAWDHSFIGLMELEDGVVCQVRRQDGASVEIKSQYVIGTDGGGSWVRKSVGLESKRSNLQVASQQTAVFEANDLVRHSGAAFVHLESKALRKMLQQIGPFWHVNVINGGIIVAQDEKTRFTVHLMLPPGVDGASLSQQHIVNLTCAGTLDPVDIPIDKVYCYGIWKFEVAIANKFRSDRGRVFLAGDSAHQLSPVGGHGLNTGLADAFDLSWKLVAAMRAWGGEQLLQSYDQERRQIAYKNLATVQHCIETIVQPLIANPGLNGELINARTPEGQKARQNLAKLFKEKHWLHDQNGNILGYQYTDSVVISYEGQVVERPVSDKSDYKPTTYPGSRAPHVWLSKGDKSILDLFNSAKLNVIDFSGVGKFGEAFADAANQLGLPLNLIALDPHDETIARRVYEADVVLVRPDGHVAWRLVQGKKPPSQTEATKILNKTVGFI
jgi:FAD-dependent monooxygenase